MKTENNRISRQQLPQKGQRYSMQITGLGHSGEGVGKLENFTVFVPGALSGETVEIQVEEVKKTYAKGKLLKIINPAAARITPVCPVYEACGGCQLQHLAYQEQLAVKRQQVVDAINRIGKLQEVVVHPTIGTDSPWNYRNKMQIPVGQSGGNIAVGCFAAGTHTIIDSPNCHIQHQTNNVIAEAIKKVLSELAISVYNEKSHQGSVRHVLGRVGTATGEVMAVLVTATKELPKSEQLIERLRQKIPGLVSIVHNVNDRQTNVVLGDYTKTIWGKDTILDRLGDLVFHISAKSFFQVNTEQAAVLYRQALTYAGLTGHETVFDVYCGTGTISLFVARHCKKVVGVEIVAPAIADAKKNAMLNTIDNAEFVCGDAVEILPRLARRESDVDVVILDPPRAGCDKRVLETIASLCPERIVYVSCNPASLARDLAILRDLDYWTVEIQPVDMFPQTAHVECVALLQRVDKK